MTHASGGEKPDVDLAAVQAWRAIRNLARALIPDGETWLPKSPGPAGAASKPTADVPITVVPTKLLQNVLIVLDDAAVMKVAPSGLVIPLESLRNWLEKHG